ncbi:MAG: hypothetical protein R2909_05015 [Gemmatimonadales bacterium]
MRIELIRRSRLRGLTVSTRRDGIQALIAAKPRIAATAIPIPTSDWRSGKDTNPTCEKKAESAGGAASHQAGSSGQHAQHGEEQPCPPRSSELGRGHSHRLQDPEHPAILGDGEQRRVDDEDRRGEQEDRRRNRWPA